MSHPASASQRVQISVTINAEPETVWRFLSEQERVLAWMTFVPGSPVPAGSRFEPRTDGEVRIIYPNGSHARGRVVEITPPRRMVFTWGYDPDIAGTGLAPGACRVEIELQRIADGTRVTLTHSGPMNDELAKGHEAGWRHYLAQLALHASHAATELHLSQTLATYWSAWNQHDAADRDKLLEACCEQTVRARTPFACVDGRAEFNDHIGNGLKHMPGLSLTADGAPRHVHGWARAAWKITAPSGAVVFRGENLFRLTPAGKIAEIVGFHT